MTQVSEQKRKIDLAFEITQLIQGLKKAEKGYLKVKSGSITWFIYIDQGLLLYVTHSIDPIDRLDCHLRGLSRRIASVTSDIRTQIRLSLDIPSTSSSFALQPDYQGIGMLLEQGILSADEAQLLLRSMSQEALELLLLVESYTATFIPSFKAFFTSLQPLNFELLGQDAQERIESWKQLAPHVISPYQRPYLFSQSQTTLSDERQQRLKILLKGYSFRHLALLVNQDELRLVKSLYPLILDKTIILREPQPPYHNLPNFSEPSLQNALVVETTSAAPLVQPETESIEHFDTISGASTSTKTYRVACIDDSPTMLHTIEQFLGKENIQLFLIQDSVKALVELMRIKPDLVLLDVGMPRVDGYELCRLLRKHPLFKKIPIIMVTGNTGLIDRARAKMSGTTDYMTKPFTQADLLKMVFRHLE